MSPDKHRSNQAAKGAVGRRTTWAEEQAEKLCSFPLTAETVFLRVKYHKGGEKEVCDLLLALQGACVVLSLKHQEDPRHRKGKALTEWCVKAAIGAVRQLDGAVKTIGNRPFWCEHARRGRVEFAPGDLSVRHAIVCVETFTPILLPESLPDEVRGVPVTYLSSNDVLNLIQELRSLPDVFEYLDARLALPSSLRRSIGRDQHLYEFYLLNGDTFDGCHGVDNLAATVNIRDVELRRRIAQKQEQRYYAMMVEYVSDSLARRDPDYAQGLDTPLLTLFDAFDDRRNYLRLQENLCNLRLGERRRLGEALGGLRQQMGNEECDFIYQSVWFDSKPDFLYMLACAKGIERAEILQRAVILLHAGLAYAQKLEGMIIVDRDGRNFEIGQAAVPEHSSEAIAAGEELFGCLATIDAPV